MSPTVFLLRHVPHEGAGTLETALVRAGLDVRYVDLFQCALEPPPLGRAAGMVVLGGPMNVDEVERYPFLKLDVAWIQEAIERRVPLLGICLGAQLLAKALGSRVYPNPVKEIGWDRVDLTPAAAEDALFARTGRLSVFQWHGDTFDLPDGAVLLAHGTACRHQAFRFGATAYGFQFHLEMTAAMIANWLAEPSNATDLSAIAGVDPVEKIRRLTPTRLPAMQTLAAEVFGRFGRMCREYFRP